VPDSVAQLRGSSQPWSSTEATSSLRETGRTLGTAKFVTRLPQLVELRATCLCWRQARRQATFRQSRVRTQRELAPNRTKSCSRSDQIERYCCRASSLTELRVLARLSEGLTITQIGEPLSIGHSSVSKIVHAAESRLGLQLVEQRGRRIYLTSPGLVLASSAREAVSQVDHVDQLADGLRSGHRGLVRVVSSSTPADYVLPNVIGELLQERPDVHVVLRVSTVLTLVQDLVDGEFDIGLGPVAPVPPGWQGELLYEDAMAFVVAPGNDLRASDSITWAELRRHLLIGQFQEPYWSQSWLALSKLPFDVDHNVELRNPEAIKRLVLKSRGVGVLARSAVAQEVVEGRLVELKVTDLNVPMPYVLYSRVGGQVRPVEDYFCLLLRKYVSGHQ
jgi:DNA-binding transcriptional LysR family regulator